MTRSSKNQTPSSRQLKAGEMLKIAVNECFMEGKLLHFGFENSMVTVTRVNVSPDLRNAKIFITSFGGDVSAEEKKNLVKTLTQPEIKNFIRKTVSSKVNFKYAPELTFKLDEEFDQLVRVQNIIHETSKKDKN